MWPPSRHVNYGLPPEFFFVAPPSQFDSHSLNASNAIGVIPLLTATPCLAQPAEDEDRSGGGMQLWQHQQGQNSSAYLITPTNLVQTGGGSSSMGAATCQDCGNQAKKDCSHRRCRTCCKSRGYDCATHVKSTWVPAARRRERLMAATAGSSQSTSGSKKPRLGAGGTSQTTTASHTSTSNTTPPGSFETSSSHQEASYKDSLPGQVRAPAVFKCVRVTAVDGGEDEYAYQASVRIGGHLFKGFLYDQGRDGLPNISELHLGKNGGSSSPPPILDIYGAASGGGLLGLGGSGYGNPMN